MAHWLGVPVPWCTVRQIDGISLLAYEHQRLLDLGRAGEQVPRVLSYRADQLVTSDLGPTLAECLDALPLAQRLSLMEAASADLGRFHARGHWHGGAQARNITWDGQAFGRIDFEEALCPPMALRTVQAYDVLQLLLSLTHYIGELGPSSVQAILRAYQRTDSAVDMVCFLRPLLPRLVWTIRMANCLPSLRHSSEVGRLQALMTGMRTFVQEN